MFSTIFWCVIICFLFCLPSIIYLVGSPRFVEYDLPDNTQKVYDELLKAVLPSAMFQGDKLMTKDGQEWEAPRNADFNWRSLVYRLLGGTGGAYFPDFEKNLDAFISRQGLSSDTKQKASSSLSDAGSNQKRWLAIFFPSRDDTIAHEGFHDVQSYLLQNYPDISSKLDSAVINREAEISDFIRNTKGLGYSAERVFASEFPLQDDENVKQLLSSQMRGESVSMMLESYKSSKNKQAQDLLSEIFAEAGLNPEFFKHF